MPPRSTPLSQPPTYLKPKPPKSVLSSRNLLTSLPQPLKPNQLELFYQQLHQQSYPPLDTFVHNHTKQQNSKKKQPPLLPKHFLQFLVTGTFQTLTSQIASHQTSSDGSTTKLTIRLHDNYQIESVIMRHTNRITICVSSQVGCAMGCTFCATGTMGIKRNLSEGEILEQLVHTSRLLLREGDGESIRNVVFMGMGEPLNNYDNVILACKAILNRRRWNLAYGRVTVSTVGILSKMKQLTKDLPEVNLALSLHAPNQMMREAIVPTAKMYPIEGLMDALDCHIETTVGRSKRKKAMIEYIMLEGPTSSFECAHQLGQLCQNRNPIVVNLIPYNPTNVKDQLQAPSMEHILEFQTIITSYKVLCYVRKTMGADIAGACGQLVVEKDIEDFGKLKEEKKKKVAVVMKKKKPKEVDRWIWPLTVGFFLSASCFVCSFGVLVWRRQRR